MGSISKPLLPGYLACVPLSCFPKGNTESIARVKKKSKHWAEAVETKLKNLGYQFPFNDTKGKTFSGLGTGGASTEGSRTLPFSLNFMDGQCTPVHGVLETHQLSTGKSPLLLSLHAQAHLGLVKDLKNGTVSIDGKQLPVFRCSHTRLMMMAINYSKST